MNKMEGKLIAAVFSFPILYNVLLEQKRRTMCGSKAQALFVCLMEADTPENNCPVVGCKLHAQHKTPPELQIHEKPDTGNYCIWMCEHTIINYNYYNYIFIVILFFSPSFLSSPAHSSMCLKSLVSFLVSPCMTSILTPQLLRQLEGSPSTSMTDHSG